MSPISSLPPIPAPIAPPIAPVRDDIRLAEVPALPAAGPAIPSPPGGDPFAAILSEAVTRVEGFQQIAQQSVRRFLAGEDEDIHKMAIAAQQADLSFDLFLQAKNKVVQAYQEVMRMQL